MKRILQISIGALIISASSVYAADVVTIDGFDPNGSNGLMTPYQQLSNQETVNLTNGVMTRQWTEAVVPGRAGLDLHLTRTLAVGKTEVVIEEFNPVFSGATTGDGKKIVSMRYHDSTISIPSLGTIRATGTDYYHNKVTYDPQDNGWDVSWAMLRGVIVMNPSGPNRLADPYVFLIHPGGELEQIRNLHSVDPSTNNLLMADVLTHPASLTVMGDDGREYFFERSKQDQLFYDADYAWVCGWAFLSDVCHEVHTNPGWTIDAYILKSVKDAFGNQIVATNPSASVNEVLRLDMLLVPTDPSYSNTLWKTVERQIFSDHEDWVVSPGSKTQRLWHHDHDEKGRFTSSTTPQKLVTTVEYDPASVPLARRLGLDYLKSPDSFVQIKYPTGGLVRYEHFITIDEPEKSQQVAIVTEMPDVGQSDKFYQKYYQISKTNTDKPDQPFITTDISTTDGAQIHQVYVKLQSTVPALSTLVWPVLDQQTWTANGRVVSAKYTYVQDGPTGFGWGVYGLSKMEVTRDGKTYPQFEGSYDKLGRLVTSKDELGRVTNYQYVLADQDLKNQYDGVSIDKKGQVIRKKGLVAVEKKTVGGQEVKLNYEYGGIDSCGGKVDDATLRKTTRQVGSSGAIPQNEKCYDVFGNVIREVSGPTPDFGINIAYDSFMVVKTSETDSQGHVTTYNIDTDTGWLNSKKSDNGTSESYVYDLDGRVLTAQVGGAATINTYNDSPSSNTITTKTTDSITNNTNVVTRVFDGLGFLKSIDDNGTIHKFSYDAAKRLSGVTYSDGNNAQFVYDGFNRLTLQTFPGKQPVKYNYILTTCVNALPFCDEIATTIGFDVAPIAKVRNDLAGRRVSTVGYLDGAAQEMLYQLDELDGITTIKSPSTLTIQDSIDYASQTMTRSLPGGDKIQISKANVMGQPEEIVFGDASQNVKASFTYDALFRPTSMDFVNADSNEKQNYYTMSYGAKGTNADGHLEKVADASGSFTEFSYGTGGVLEGVTRNIKGMSPLKTYVQKDAYGNPVLVIYPNGLSIYYARDGKNRVTEVRKGSATGIVLAKMAYDVRDNLTSLAYANGIATDYEYDLAGHVTRIASHKGDKYILDERYTYDALGNKISVTHQDGSRTAYTYDGLSHLIKAEYFKKNVETPYNTQEYGYDLDGNRISYKDSIKEIQYVMEGKDGTRTSNRVASYTVSENGKPSVTAQFEYSLGNLIKQTESQNGVPVLTKTFTYDKNNRLIQAVIKDSRTGFQTDSQYTYDYAGRRELVSVNGSKSYYGYGEALDPLVRVNDKNEIEAAYIYIGMRRLAAIEGDKINFFQTDELGSTLKLMDENGNTTQSIRYDPFGNINFLNGASENSYLFAGKPRDEATGLIYFGARYYDPLLGRFLTRDPAGQGFNHYIYADNNPLVRNDVFGLAWYDLVVSFFTGELDNPFWSKVTELIGFFFGGPKDNSFNSQYSDVIGGGNSFSGGSGYGCGGPTNICYSPKPPPSGNAVRPTGALSPKISLINATSFGLAQAGGKSILPSTDISGRNKPSGQQGASNTAWQDFLNLYKTNAKTIKNDINSNKNYSSVPSLQNSAKQSETVQSSNRVMDDANRTISSGNTPNVPGNTANFIAPQQSNIVAANMTDTTDKGSIVVQQGQTQNTSKEGTNAVGDPVFLHSGDLLQSEVDLKIPGRGMDYEFRRTYRSRIQFDGPLGANWDHNYNKHLVPQDNGDIARFDGDARFDIYKKNDDGTYASPSGRFDVLSKLPDGTYQIRDRHGVFYRYNGAGFITSITDSNNNSLNFEYADVAGASRLVKVTDTLGRAIQYQYYTSGGAVGHLQKITDFAGRSVQFTIDGNLDLVAVTSPATSDFPSGKKVQYAYSSGFTDDRSELNHNLLKVTDAKGQVVLQNTYSIFDRVLTQKLGNVGQFTFDYHPLTAVGSCDISGVIGDVAYRTTVTDRSQNQSVYEFNCQGNPLTITKYTRGIRPGDPAAFLTSYTYNIDGLPTAVTLPDGNSMQWIYADTTGLPATVARWSAGNLMEVRKVADAKRGGGSPLVTDIQYELLYNKPVAVTDPRGFITRIWYDYQEGLTTNDIAPLLGTTADKVLPLYPAGLLSVGDVNGDGNTQQIGGNVVGVDLPKVHDVDGAEQVMAQRFRYNNNGQLTRAIDAAGVATDYAYQNGYVSQVTSDTTGLAITRSFARDSAGNVTSATDGNGKATQFSVNALNQVEKVTDPLGHFTNFTYDANNNVVQIDRQNVDENGATLNGNPLATTKFDYNVLNRPTLRRDETAEGKYVVTEYQYDANENLARLIRPEGNSVVVQYDERDLPYKVSRGFGTADVATTAYSYSGSGETTQIIDPVGHVTIVSRDGFDRPILSTNSAGNTTLLSYDAASQITEIQKRGPPTVGGDPSTLLWSQAITRDELGRQITAVETGLTSKFYYNAQNLLTKQVDPQSRTTQFVYDPVGRLLQQILPNGDKAVQVFDAEGRVVTASTIEAHATLGAQTTTTQFQYDALGHLTQRQEPQGAVWKYQYDSHGRPRVVVAPDDIQQKFAYDDLGRLKTSTNNDVATTFAWDDDSRLTTITDAKSNVTQYAYDALDRRTQTTLADGSVQTVRYSATSMPIEIKMPNGFLLGQMYDQADNLVMRIIQKDGAIVGKEQFGYDGLSRMLSGKELDANGATQHDLGLTYDTRSNVTQSMQDSLQLQRTFSVGNDLQSVTYPGQIGLTLARDTIGRLTTITDKSLGALQTVNYAAGLLPFQMIASNGVTGSFTYDTGKRISQLAWANTTKTLSQHAYTYDAVSDLLIDNNPNSNVGDVYHYDGQRRLANASLSVPNAPNFANSVPATFDSQKTYAYDDLGNWTQTASKPDNTTTAYASNALNQYTTAGSATLQYDKNGNLTQDETFSYSYNWRNLITEVRAADNSLVASYQYDALSRRVAKVDGLSGDVTKYVYDGWNVAEERATDGSLQASYVYSDNGLPVAMNRGGKLYFYNYNHLGSIESVTNAAGDVVEQYRYDAFGNRTVADGSGNALPETQIENSFGFAGQWRDAETGLYYMRHRYYSPQLGRFLSRDPLEYADSMNAYAYAMSNPVNFSDPLGLSTSASVLNTGAGNPMVQSRVSAHVGPYDMFPSTALPSTGNTFADGMLESVVTVGNLSAAALNVGTNAVGYFDALLGKTGCDLLCMSISAEQVPHPVSRMAGYGAQSLIESASGLRSVMMGGVRANTLGEVVVGTSELSPGVKYIGKLDDLQSIPRDQTLLDALPDLGNAQANYYQNSSVLRGAIRDGYEIRDASAYRSNWSLDPTRMRPDRTLGQSFLGAERNIMDNRGFSLGPNGVYIPKGKP